MLKLHRILAPSRCVRDIFCRPQMTTSPNQRLNESQCNAENLKDLMSRRRDEAKRSVMLEVNTKDVCGQVYHHCKQFGEIKNAFLYTLKDERNLMLVIEAVNETFKFCGFQQNTVKWPNRVLTVRNSKLNSSLPKEAPLKIENAVEPHIANILRDASSFDEQVNLLYEHTQLTDLSIRLKFISALQAQIIVNEYLDEIFPNAKVYPFGSSVNGFGKMGCDLDMALRFDQITDSSEENDHMPLAFQGKDFEGAEEVKKLEGRQVKCMASLIDYFLPGTQGVSAFSGAKVPIVRYFDANIHSSVDLSVNNLERFHITEFMYAMGLLDPRIRPFIFMVRRWAKEFEITRYNARDNFTNFQLTYMCLSFLQQLKEPLCPTFEDVFRQIGKNQSSSVESIVKDTFIFNFDQFEFKTKNTSTVLELFAQFLEYFESYEFDKYMITLRTTEKLPKPDPSPLYLENIFDSTHFWGSNVSDAECSTLKIMIRETQQELEQCSSKPTDKTKDWGLLEIISKLK